MPGPGAEIEIQNPSRFHLENTCSMASSSGSKVTSVPSGSPASKASGSDSPTASQGFDFKKLMRSVASVDKTTPLHQLLEKSRRLLRSFETAFFSRALFELLTRPHSESLERTVEIALDALVFDLNGGTGSAFQNSGASFGMLSK